MGRKRSERIEHHKQSLGDQLENPETYGVRVSNNCAHKEEGTFNILLICCMISNICAAPHLYLLVQTKPRPEKRRKGQESEEDEEVR